MNKLNGKSTLLGLAISMLALPAWADMPPSNLIAVRLILSTDTLVSDHYYSTVTSRGHFGRRRVQSPRVTKFPGARVDGYIMWSSGDPQIRFASATAREQIPVSQLEAVSFWPLADLFEVEYPRPSLVSTTSVMGHRIPITSIKRMEKISAPLDGRMLQMWDLKYISSEQAKLRRSPPVFSCKVYGGEMSDEILVSYNPSVTEATMRSLCNKNSDPNVIPLRLSDDELAEFLKNKDVFVVHIPVD